MCLAILHDQRFPAGRTFVVICTRRTSPLQAPATIPTTKSRTVAGMGETLDQGM